MKVELGIRIPFLLNGLSKRMLYLSLLKVQLTQAFQRLRIGNLRKTWITVDTHLEVKKPSNATKSSITENGHYERSVDDRTGDKRYFSQLKMMY
jgi:hypothetical protein